MKNALKAARAVSNSLQLIYHPDGQWSGLGYFIIQPKLTTRTSHIIPLVIYIRLEHHLYNDKVGPPRQPHRKVSDDLLS